MLGVTSFLQGSTDGRHEAVSLGTWPAIAASSGSRPLPPLPPSPPPILPFLISVNFSFDAVQSFNPSKAKFDNKQFYVLLMEYLRVFY